MPEADACHPAPVGWGIIGCGDVVVHKSGPSIALSPGSRIVGVMRRDPEKARTFAAAHGIGLCTDQADEVIDHPAVEIVYVATPPSSHKEYVLRAAAAGRHVLVEKPMGLSAAEDREMIDACARSGVELFISYYRRFHPQIVRMKEIVDGGDIGQPVFARVDYAQPPQPGRDWGWRLQRDIGGGGLFVDTVSHRIDLLNFFLGWPGGIKDVSTRVSGDEMTSALIRYPNGCAAVVTGDFATGRASDVFEIRGTRGALFSPMLDRAPIELTRNGTTESLPWERPAATHFGLVGHIESVIRGRSANTCSGWDGLLTDLALDSACR
jgi:predicted dehydrogenase